MIVCLERDANDLHVVQLIPLPPHQAIRLLSRRLLINMCMCICICTARFIVCHVCRF